MLRIEEVKTIMEGLCNNSQYPTVEAVRSKMKSPASFRNPVIRETYHSMLKKLGLK